MAPQTGSALVARTTPPLPLLQGPPMLFGSGLGIGIVPRTEPVLGAEIGDASLPTRSSVLRGREKLE